VSGHWSAWQAARVEVKQEAEDAKREEVTDKVVDKIVDRTEIQPDPAYAARNETPAEQESGVGP
jgi:hypothetical protein